MRPRQTNTEARKHLAELRRYFQAQHDEVKERADSLRGALAEAESQLEKTKGQLAHLDALEKLEHGESPPDGGSNDTASEKDAASDSSTEPPSDGRSMHEMAFDVLQEFVPSMVEPMTQGEFLDLFESRGVTISKGTNFRVLQDGIHAGLLVKREADRPGRERFEYGRLDMFSAEQTEGETKSGE